VKECLFLNCIIRQEEVMSNSYDRIQSHTSWQPFMSFETSINEQDV
jgi:hypothetical protein